MPKKIAVILATYGEVEEATFKHLYPNSSRILHYITSRIANLPKPLQVFIATMRSLKRKSYWGKLGYRSKLNEVTRNQTKALQVALNQRSNEKTYVVRDAYYFVPPYFETVMNDVRDFDAVITVPMIPIESEFACGIACYIAVNDFREMAFQKVRVMKHLWNSDELAQICVNHVFEQMPKKLPAKVGLVLTAHGTLVKDNNGETPKINTGYQETLDFFEKLKSAFERDARNPFASIKLGAMNHKFGGEWMPETLAKALEEFKAEGIDEIVMFPFGFFADNSEADLEGVEEASAAGVKVHYVSCLNDSEPFINWLAARIEQKAKWLELTSPTS
ncbi:MAG: ferrochelatase [Chloroherpetonaceae bacterium]